MSDLTEADMALGFKCYAPLKSNKRSRELKEVRVCWVSYDGKVVEVETLHTRGYKRETMAVCRLRRNK